MLRQVRFQDIGAAIPLPPIFYINRDPPVYCVRRSFGETFWRFIIYAR